jgi:hypothetical protein
MVTLDFIARRYSTTPTKLLESGTTFDLYVAELAAGYEQYITSEANKGQTPNNNGLSVEEMQDMLNKVRNK